MYVHFEAVGPLTPSVRRRASLMGELCTPKSMRACCRCKCVRTWRGHQTALPLICVLCEWISHTLRQ